MRCPQCGHENGAELKFCGECGARLALLCSECGARNLLNQKFCGECGARLATGAPTRTQSPESYTPKHLAERILGSKAALEGERKQVTVLFADLKGSMELLADRDPEEARKILDPVLELMMEAVHHYEGTVNQVMGDGIMALFGAPLAHEDHAVRACYAALRMQESVKRYIDELHRTEEGVPIQIRVGLNSGQVVVRSIGSDLHMDYTAVGHTTHLAARMEQIATPGSVLISPATLRLVEGYVVVKSLGPRPIRGLEASLEVHEITGITPVRSRFHAAASRGLSRFVGRDLEIEQLHQTLEQAHRGQGQVVAVVGQPGVGKSRLIWELMRSHHTSATLTLETGCVPYGTATPWLPVVKVLKDQIGIEKGDDSATIRDKLTARLCAIDGDLLPLASALLSLLDIAPNDSAWAALDSFERRQRTTDAIKRLLFRASQDQPIVMIVEDLQWIDSASQALLDSVVRDLPECRLFLLVTYRPEYKHTWGGRAHYAELPVVSLEQQSAEELLHWLLGPHPDLIPLRRLLIQRTEGNPFFIEESVRSLAEAGILEGERGAYRPTGSMTSVHVPTTVYAVLAARIDRLTPEQKDLLQTASVIGRDVPLSLLQKIAEAPEEALLSDLAHLQAADFIYPRTLFPEPEYSFKHALTHEVTYQGLLRSRQRALHARALEAMEAASTDRLSDDVDHLAHHAFFGEVWDKALAYARQAGARTVGRSAHLEAIEWFARALQALQHLHDNPERTEQTVDLHLLRANSLIPIGEFGPVVDHLREAERHAHILGDQWRLGTVSSFLSVHSWITGDPKLALEYGQRALAISQDLGDIGLRVRANYSLGQAYHVLGNYDQAIDVLERNVEELQGDLVRRRFGLLGAASVVSRSWLVWCLAEQGEFERAAPRGEEAVRIAKAINHPYSLLAAYFGVGLLQLVRGQLSEAITILETALDLCQTWDTQHQMWFMAIAPSLGHAYALSGKATQGIPLLDKAIEQAVARGSMFGQSLRMGWLAHALRAAGRVKDARRVALEALDLARRYCERGHEARVHGVLGQIVAEDEPEDDAAAKRAYSEQIAIASELRMRPLVAHSHLGLGKLYARTGEREQAHKHLTTATTMYREMGMTYWLEKAEAELTA